MTELVKINEIQYMAKEYIIDKYKVIVTSKDNQAYNMSINNILNKQFALNIKFNDKYNKKIKMISCRKMTQDQIKELISDYQAAINILKMFASGQLQ